MQTTVTLVVAIVLAATPSAGAQESLQRPRLVLEGLDGTRREIDPAGISLTDPRSRDAWLVLPQGFVAPPPAEEEGEVATVLLAGGDELRGRIAGGDGEALSLEMIGGVRLPIEISQLERIVLPEHFPEGQLEPLEAPEEGDRLYRLAGPRLDRIDGTVDAFTDEGVSFDSVLGTKVFPWSEIAALYIEVLGEPASGSGEGTPIVCDLTDGSRVRGTLVEIDGTHCRMQVAGAELALDLGHVAEIAVDDGALVFLSDLTPLREEGRGVPFGDELGMVWPYRIDRAVSGGPLTTAGRVWRRGIGMHAPTKVVWALDGEYRRLRGSVGIDDSALWNPEEARGSVVFRVLLDGKSEWESGVVRGGDGVTALPVIELGAARELTLEVDMAGDFRGDRANWLRMMLIR